MDQLSTSAGVGGRWPAIWREFFRFIRKPRLFERREPFGLAALKELAWLFVLGGAAVGLFIGAFALIKATGAAVPEYRKVDLPYFTLIAILLAPPLEELVFRSWLRGRRSDLTIAIALVILFVLLALAGRLLGPGIAIALLLAWAVVTGVELFRSRRRRSQVPAFYARAFPAFFWLSCLAFGLSHMFNYSGPVRLALAIMALPQLMVGTILAFARLRYGMWANVAMHVTWNAALILIDLAFG